MNSGDAPATPTRSRRRTVPASSASFPVAAFASLATSQEWPAVKGVLEIDHVPQGGGDVNQLGVAHLDERRRLELEHLAAAGRRRRPHR